MKIEFADIQIHKSGESMRFSNISVQSWKSTKGLELPPRYSWRRAFLVLCEQAPSQSDWSARVKEKQLASRALC